MSKPEQTEPLLNPNKPATDNRYPYYLLEEMNSPPISTPNALRWEAYPAPRYIHDRPDDRIAYGFIVYEEQISWADLEKYNMLPFDYEEAILFDLWKGFGKNKARLLAFFRQFFKLVDGDDELIRLGKVLKLKERGWTPAKVHTAVKEIK